MKEGEFTFSATLSLPSPSSDFKVPNQSIDDGDGSENVTFKMNSPVFKLCRVYSNSANSLKMSAVGKFPWTVDFLRPHSSLERERKFRVRLFTSSIKREIRHFHVVVVQ